MNKTEADRPTGRTAPKDAPPRPRKPLIVGITGGIGAGKSAAAAVMREIGGAVLDADRIAHDVLRSPDVTAEIRRAWTEDVFDAKGMPDRAKIARVVFDRPEKLKQLNGWIHPRVRRIIRGKLDEELRAAKVPLIVIDAPLLLEGKLDAWCDRILFVEATRAVRSARARRERNWGDEEIGRREAMQEPLDRKRRRADAVVANDGGLNELRAQVERCVKEFLRSRD